MPGEATRRVFRIAICEVVRQPGSAIVQGAKCGCCRFGAQTGDDTVSDVGSHISVQFHPMDQGLRRVMAEKESQTMYSFASTLCPAV